METYFVVVVHNVDNVFESAVDKPQIWIACVTNSYPDAEQFQLMLLKVLGHGDRCVIIGANLGTGDGTVDIKAVLIEDVN